MTSQVSSLQVLQWARASMADSDPTSLVRNQEFNNIVGPLVEASHAAAQLLNVDGSISIVVSGQQFTLGLNVKTSANVVAGQGYVGLDADHGLYVVLGTGANQAAAGNHTHADATEETDGFMGAADKAKLDGMQAGATSLALAGSGAADTAAHSDHTHADATEETDGFMAAADKVKLDGLPTADQIAESVLETVVGALQNTATVSTLFTGGLLSFNVLLAAEFASMEGQIINAQAGGLAVQLGTSGNVAAAGNHTHPDATESTPGFLSAEDKAKIDSISNGSGYATLESPDFTGVPQAPTALQGTNTSQLATTAFVVAAITALVGGAPGALDTLKDLADALGDSADFATTITNALALKAPLASPALTGTPTAPTPASDDSSTKLATTAFVTGAIAPLATSDALAAAVAPLATQTGNYPDLTAGAAGSAENDGEGNSISATYATQTGSYGGMTAGTATAAIGDQFGANIYENYAQQTGTYSEMSVNYATYSNSATTAFADMNGLEIDSNYALQTGTYEGMSVGSAENDGEGNSIAATYATQTGSYSGMTAGTATAAIGDQFGANIYENYAQQTGTYSEMSVNYATYSNSATTAFADMNGLEIDSNYALQTGTYEGMSVGYASEATCDGWGREITAIYACQTNWYATLGAGLDSNGNPFDTCYLHNVDTGWTANADAGDKTVSIADTATLTALAGVLNGVAAGAGDQLLNVCQKLKAMEAALVGLLLPNA